MRQSFLDLRVQIYAGISVFNSPWQKMVLIFLTIWALPPCLQAQDTDILLNKADSLYLNAQEQASLAVYEKVLTEKRRASPRMLFRMAYMEENRGRIPQTLYYLSLLYNLYPDEAARAKIESLARQYKLDGYDFDELDLFRQMLRRYSVALFALFAVVVGAMLFVLWRRRRQGRQLRLLPAAIVLLLALAAAVLNINLEYGKAVVFHPELPVMAGPASAAKVVDFVPAGTRLTVTGSEEAWVRVVYKGRQGYVNRFWVGYF